MISRKKIYIYIYQSDIKFYFTRHIKCETGEPHRKADPGSRDLICANGGVNIVE